LDLAKGQTTRKRVRRNGNFIRFERMYSSAGKELQPDQNTQGRWILLFKATRNELFEVILYLDFIFN